MILTSIFSWLLYHANREPGAFNKTEFYRIKNGLLSLYGTPDGRDLQVLPAKKCYKCNGTGRYAGWDWSGPSEECYDCYGTGKFKPELQVPLNRYRLGRRNYIFHQPVGESYEYGKLPHKYYPTHRQINGLIQKDGTPYSSEAMLWLFLLFRPALFVSMLQRIVRFSEEDRGFWVGLHRLYRYCEKEVKRRRTHLDFGQKAEPCWNEIFGVVSNEDLPF